MIPESVSLLCRPQPNELPAAGEIKWMEDEQSWSVNHDIPLLYKLLTSYRLAKFSWPL